MFRVGLQYEKDVIIAEKLPKCVCVCACVYLSQAQVNVCVFECDCCM